MILPIATPTDSGYSGSQQPIIQNLGPGVLYIGSNGTDLENTGLYLPAGAIYEYPATLVNGAGSVWLLATLDTVDVRIINIG
jgi:hypothetical protein